MCTCIATLHILLLLTQVTSVNELLELPIIFPIWPCSPVFLQHPAPRPLLTCCTLGFLVPFRLFLPHLRWPPKLSTSCITHKAQAALVLPSGCMSEAWTEAASSSAMACGVRGRQEDSSGESRKHGKGVPQTTLGRKGCKIYTCCVQRKSSWGSTSTSRQMLQQRQHRSNACVFSKAGQNKPPKFARNRWELDLKASCPSKNE